MSVPTGEELPANPAGLVTAAHAVASWARARRATWAATPGAAAIGAPTAEPASAPPPRPARPASPPIDIRPPAPVFAAEPLAATIITTAPPPPAAARQPQAPMTFGTAEREPRTSGGRSVARIAAAAAVIAAVAFGAKYLLSQRSSEPAPVARRATAPPPAPAAAPSPVVPRTGKRTGALRVNSTPTGAQVIVDGKPRGATPLTLDAISVGRHSVEIQSSEGTVRRTVTVSADQAAEVDEAIYAGWIAVDAPFDVTVSEKGRSLSTDERNQIMLRPGTHELHVTNAALGFDGVQTVDVKPGQVTSLHVAPPQSTITVTASDEAEVWIDSTRAGVTPLNAFPIGLGTHDLVVRRAAGGERRLSLTVTSKPVTVNVDFTKPGA